MRVFGTGGVVRRFALSAGMFACFLQIAPLPDEK